MPVKIYPASQSHPGYDHIIQVANWWFDPAGIVEITEDQRFRDHLATLPESGRAYLDTEGLSYSMLRKGVGTPEYKKSIAFHIALLAIAREVRPKIKWGFWGLPLTDRWNQNDAWNDLNMAVARDLTDHCDELHVGTYDAYATRNIEDQIETRAHVSLALKMHPKVVIHVSQRFWSPIDKPEYFTTIPDQHFKDQLQAAVDARHDGRKPSAVAFWSGDEWYWNVSNQPAPAPGTDSRKKWEAYNNVFFNEMKAGEPFSAFQHRTAAHVLKIIEEVA